MTETLYRTRTPQAAAYLEESFELSLGKQAVAGQVSYYVRETQCWWDGVANRTLRVQYTLSPREGFAAIEEAHARYQLQRMDRARRGFIHSFTPSYDSNRKHKYVLIRVAAPTEHSEPAKTTA